MFRQASGKNLLFNIMFEHREIMLQMSQHATVGQLKMEIYEKLDISPSKQVIDSWYNYPENDSETLINCCHSETNCLIVYIADDSNRDETDEGKGLQFLDSETCACMDFIEKFSKTFDDQGILFHVCKLEQALNEACFISPEHRRTLLLYLHNETDKFAKLFGQCLTDPEVKEIVNDRFFLLGWNLENRQYHRGLIDALNKKPELSSLSSFVEKQTCAALLIVPLKDSFVLFSCMKAGSSKKDILATLRQADEFLLMESVNEAELSTSEDFTTDIGSIEYQQLMLDQLGDRDYDSYDFEEFDELKKKIAYALYGPPENEEGYPEKLLKNVEKLFKIIVKENNSFAKWKDRVVMSCIYNCTEPLPSEKKKRAKKYKDYNPKTDLNPVPVFVLRKCKDSENPCRIFVDNIGRVYSTWEGYIRRNKLPECEMILPWKGRYQFDSDGKVILERHMSPACGIDVKILDGTDKATTAVGLVSGGVFVAAAIPAITVAPVALIAAGAAGLGVGLYSLGRSIYTLVDRGTHKETLSFADSEARGAYLNIVAGSLGFVGAGAAVAVSQLASAGVNIGQGARGVVNVISVANIGASGAAVANSTYEVLYQWIKEDQAPSALTILQLSSSILFFGHAVYNFQSAGTIIEESQARTLRDYQDSLRSNRHRKTFNKMLKETIRRNEGNKVKGQAEVIKTVTHIQNKDEVFATLTRLNKEMNKNDVKFSAENGIIKLNGVEVDMISLGKMEKNDAITYLSSMPNGSEPSSNEVNIVKTKLSFGGSLNSKSITDLAIRLVKILGNTEDTVKEKIINAFTEVVNLISSSALCQPLSVMFPGLQRFMKLFQMVNKFFQTLINDIEDKYQMWLKTRDPNLEEPIFQQLAFDLAKRTTQIFEFATQLYFSSNTLTKFGAEQLEKYFKTWFTKQSIEFEEARERKKQRVSHSGSPASKTCCPVCGGNYYK